MNEKDLRVIYSNFCLSIMKNKIEEFKPFLNDKKILKQILNMNDCCYPLILIVESGNTKMLELLLETDIDININMFDWNFTTYPLQIAIDRQNLDMVDLLLQCKDIDINIDTHYHMLPALMNASIVGNLYIVNKLLERDEIDVNYQDIYDFTSIIRASMNNHHNVVERLLKCKEIDINLRCRYTNLENGRTALDIASKKGNKKIVNLLKNFRNNEIHKGFLLAAQCAEQCS